ncbi:MAG: calcium-binding protein [Nitrospinae bacterium]|nr:calcium-binding protein [Nitrospinota bacterium]
MTSQKNTVTDTSGDNTHAATGDADVFVFTAGNGDDTITGFAGGSDLIDLRAFPEIRSFDDLTVTSDTDGVTIDLTDHGGGTILLQGISVGDLDGEDFIFATWKYGGGANDRLLGDDTSENIDALGGNDTVFGGGGDDRIHGGEGQDSLLGDAGDDTIFGGEGNDWVVGGAGDDALYGGAGNDRLIEGAGNDELFGGSGADTLNGGAGDDALTGGAGADTFFFNGSFGDDKITDFADGEDTIDLTAMTSITGFADLSIRADGNDAVIDLTSQGGGTIRLENFDVNDLDASDFNFYDSSSAEPEVDGI